MTFPSPRGYDTAMLIVFEGIDGSGKSTVARSLYEDLYERQRLVQHITFPSKRPIGVFLRKCLNGEETINPIAYQHLFIADALDNDAQIRTWIDQGNTVICDRHPTVSSWVYGIEHFSLPTILSINVAQLFTRPSLIVVLDVPSEVAAKRLFERGGMDATYDTVDLSKIEQRRSRYFATVNLSPLAYAILDGTKSTRVLVDVSRGLIDDLALKQN